MNGFSVIKWLDTTVGSFSIKSLKKANQVLSKKTSGDVKKILLIKFGNIGDVLVTIPAIKAVRKKFPKTEIVMLTSGRTKGLYNQYPYIDRVITRGVVGDKGVIQNVFLTLLNIPIIISVVWKENFDLAIDLESYSRFSAFLTLISRANPRLGLGIEGSNRSESFTHTIPYIKRDRHEVNTFLELISLIGIKTSDKKPEIMVSRKDKDYATRILQELNLKEGPKIVVHAGGNPDWMIKRWPKKGFIEVINKILQKYKANVLLVGSPDDREVSEEIFNAVKSSRISNIVGKTNLNQLAALISKCDLFLGNDSAPMHISAAVNTPSVVIMNYVNPKRWGPYGKINITLTSASDKSPHWNGYLGDPKVEENFVQPIEVTRAVERQIKRVKNE